MQYYDTNQAGAFMCVAVCARVPCCQRLMCCVRERGYLGSLSAPRRRRAATVSNMLVLYLPCAASSSVWRAIRAVALTKTVPCNSIRPCCCADVPPKHGSCQPLTPGEPLYNATLDGRQCPAGSGDRLRPMYRHCCVDTRKCCTRAVNRPRCCS